MKPQKIQRDLAKTHSVEDWVKPTSQIIVLVSIDAV